MRVLHAWMRSSSDGDSRASADALSGMSTATNSVFCGSDRIASLQPGERRIDPDMLVRRLGLVVIVFFQSQRRVAAACATILLRLEGRPFRIVELVAHSRWPALRGAVAEIDGQLAHAPCSAS